MENCMRLRVRDLEGDRRVRDRDGPPVDGEWRGTHPPGSTFHEDNNGRLTIYDGDGELMCTYEPGAWHVAEDREGVHVGRTGEHDPFPKPETPERIDVRDNHPAALRELNARNAAFWKRQPK
jgi:hypothetical protein